MEEETRYRTEGIMINGREDEETHVDREGEGVGEREKENERNRQEKRRMREIL